MYMYWGSMRYIPLRICTCMKVLWDIYPSGYVHVWRFYEIYTPQDMYMYWGSMRYIPLRICTCMEVLWDIYPSGYVHVWRFYGIYTPQDMYMYGGSILTWSIYFIYYSAILFSEVRSW
jgi:hypothetical protein